MLRNSIPDCGFNKNGIGRIMRASCVRISTRISTSRHAGRSYPASCLRPSSPGTLPRKAGPIWRNGFDRCRRSAEKEKGLAEPFEGITTNGTVEPGLFDLHSTGVSTAPVRVAAERFLASLTKRAARPDYVRGRRLGMAQMDEPAFLCAPRHQPQGNDGDAARGGVRPFVGVAERARHETDAGHHEVE